MKIKQGDHIVVHGTDHKTGITTGRVYPENGDPFEVWGSTEPTGNSEPYYLEPCSGAPQGVAAFHAHSPDRDGKPPMFNSQKYCEEWERIFRNRAGAN